MITYIHYLTGQKNMKTCLGAPLEPPCPLLLHSISQTPIGLAAAGTCDPIAAPPFFTQKDTKPGGGQQTRRRTSLLRGRTRLCCRPGGAQAHPQSSRPGAAALPEPAAAPPRTGPAPVSAPPPLQRRGRRRGPASACAGSSAAGPRVSPARLPDTRTHHSSTPRPRRPLTVTAPRPHTGPAPPVGRQAGRQRPRPRPGAPEALLPSDPEVVGEGAHRGGCVGTGVMFLTVAACEWRREERSWARRAVGAGAALEAGGGPGGSAGGGGGSCPSPPPGAGPAPPGGQRAGLRDCTLPACPAPPRGRAGQPLEGARPPVSPPPASPEEMGPGGEGRGCGPGRAASAGVRERSAGCL